MASYHDKKFKNEIFTYEANERGAGMNIGLELIRKFGQAYRIACKPVCKEFGLPQTAFDILMFLGNNPEYKTASDIVEIRNIKANLVSMYVDRLVKEGFLARKTFTSARRYSCTSAREKPGRSWKKEKKYRKNLWRLCLKIPMKRERKTS